MTQLSTLDIQKALTIAAFQNAHITGPGALDGRWGPHTQASFDSWVAQQSPDVTLGAGVLGRPSRGAMLVDLPLPVYGVLYSLAQIYNAREGTSQQTPAPAQRAFANATASAAAAAVATSASTPAQRAAASAAISQGAGQNASHPMLPQSALLLQQQSSGGPLGIDWWIWALLGTATAATAGGLYWYYTQGKRHHRRR